MAVPPEATDERAKAKALLDELAKALDSSGPGDQVVFSLSDHGFPGMAAQSCVHFGPNGKVCTFTGSGRMNSSYGDAFWKKADRAKKPGAPLPLSEVRTSQRWIDELATGGGFGSQVIREALCEGGKGRSPDFVDLDLAFAPIRAVERDLSRMEGDIGCLLRDHQPLDSGDLDSLVRIQGVLSRSQSNVRLNALCDRAKPYFSEEVCRAAAQVNQDLDSLHGYSGALFDTVSDLMRAEQELTRIDAGLATSDVRASGTASSQIEAQRGEVLDRRERLRADAIQQVSKIQAEGLPTRIRDALGTIEDSLCLKSRVPFDDLLILAATYTTGPLGGTRVPATDAALEAAKRCEASFVLP